MRRITASPSHLATTFDARRHVVCTITTCRFGRACGGQSHHLCKGERAVDRVAGAPLRSLQECWLLRPDEPRPGFSNSPGIVSPVSATKEKQKKKGDFQVRH
ncbi:uncharacterized protein PgNI_09689 [Pyricularia grisea]|uniref:Uncharacterized protein n=1 Tax=Pyricularia grisea TaxID=148305 RepID=A0A6P8AT64_PYRGI|nr:uncharacterized protein PgNI_09689 [Pyricularia grisea]TLD05324.1 hypothetical protein PgNI_09689 [Pyricularia grisea]